MGNITRSWVLPPRGLRVLLLSLMVMGIFFRFINLDRKVYWHDEAFTSLRISGYTTAEIVDQMVENPGMTLEDLQKYQSPNPHKGIVDTITSLATEDSQHPPLYYLLARWWVQAFGYSVAGIRRLSAVISLLAFPCIYWLCLELFNSSFVGWVAIALIAVSPFHILYAQEAREYSLWTVTILLSSAALLYGRRLNTRRSWSLYSGSLILGLYTFPFTGLVAIGHGIYMLGIEKFRLNKPIIHYLLATGAGFLAFAPWLFVMIANFSKISNTNAWSAKRLPLLSLLKAWILNLTRLFLDIDFSFTNPLTYLIVPIIIFIGYSLVFLWLNTPKRIGLFILTLVGVTGLTLMLPDLILGGQRSKVIRYLIPSLIGIQLACAFLITMKLTSRQVLRQKVWSIIALTILSLGIVSGASSFQSATWWNKFQCNDNVPIAQLINQTENAEVISDQFGILFSLKYNLKPSVKLKIVKQIERLDKLPINSNKRFIATTDRKFINQFKQIYDLSLVYRGGIGLWTVNTKN